MSISLFVPKGSIVYPGRQLCNFAENLNLGAGVYSDNKICIASTFGVVDYIQTPDNYAQLFLTPLHHNASHGDIVTIDLNDIVIGKVSKVEPHFAIITIVAVKDVYVSYKMEGMIKKEHIGVENAEKTKTSEALLPGDIVIAKVKSLSESKKILLSIAEPDLGVIIARDEDGTQLTPISDAKMKNIKSGKIYQRKVACLNQLA